MNQNIIIGIVAAVIVVGGGWWLVANREAGPEGALDNTQQGTMNGQGTGTFASLMAMGGSYACDVKTNFDGNVSEGRVYINGKNLRGDFTSTVNNQVMTTHMIHTGEYMWSWTDGIAQGIKMPIPQASASGDTTTSNTQFDYNQNVEYTCAPWMVDQTLLTPPTTIDFMELGENGMPQGVPAMPSGYDTGAGGGSMPSPEELERLRSQYGQ